MRTSVTGKLGNFQIGWEVKMDPVSGPLVGPVLGPVSSQFVFPLTCGSSTPSPAGNAGSAVVGEPGFVAHRILPFGAHLISVYKFRHFTYYW